MIAELNWKNKLLKIDFSAGRSLAIILDPHGPQPSFFAGTPAKAVPLQIADYIGDVTQGGSCNAEVLQFVPHCHGTHTECVAHLDRSTGNVLDLIDQKPCLARLVTVRSNPVDGYATLTLEDLKEQLGPMDELGPEAIIIRTLPNDEGKLCRDYEREPDYPVLCKEAIDWLAQGQFRHLLIDTPSLDKAHDGGQLANHRSWWGLNQSDTIPNNNRASRSITEMIFVPDVVEDGYYWLHLELQPLAADATSSRPVIYPIEIVNRKV